MSIDGQGHFFTIYFQVLYVLARISGERLEDHWSSGFNSYSRPRYQVSVYRTIGLLVKYTGQKQ